MAASHENGVQTTDPMQLLPSELVLRILEFTPASGLAALTRLNRSWNTFIDHTHQEAIYSHPSKTNHPPGAKDFQFLSSYKTYSRYFSNVESWKVLCRRQTLLSRNWLKEIPETRETLVGVRNGAVWRFRPDFKRRFFLNTSQMGGLDVTDMDTGELLFRLDAETVRPFAHLEYQDGTAVWDKVDDALEVWRTDLEGCTRGCFRRVAVLPHDRQTRGFQLSYDTLCVVSSECRGFVYDMKGTPELQRTIEIEEGAVGHLDQCEDVVVFSLGLAGYHFYEKASGRFLGTLDPTECENLHHIIHPASDEEITFGYNGVSTDEVSNVMVPRHIRFRQLVPLKISVGGYPREMEEGISLEEDEWGAGMICGNLMVGVSRGGRIFACSNWRSALQSHQGLVDNSAIVECDSNGSTFDLGGWLSVRDHRMLCEVKEKVYVLGLTDDDQFVSSDRKTAHPSFAFGKSMASLFGAPVSFMAFYDDCIMTTYTTLRYVEEPAPQIFGHQQPVTRTLPTKAIRIVSLAPRLSDGHEEQRQEGRPPTSDGVVHGIGSEELIAMLDGAGNVEEVSDDEEGNQFFVDAEENDDDLV
ncbi:hypothetical protein DOTSEDRAFT_87725 [Lecanosticta acicola]|uniref:F-box domain-containing protein n=1 Tax=Lecanosticta acicola TaxID=111012 RepID=A0AAI8Z724_9PEZI|nr:hypothetical protein DOTSEDRAFT_87725 [Lecanosticta acicola]